MMKTQDAPYVFSAYSQIPTCAAVSYTHLDVYKRQTMEATESVPCVLEMS